MTNRTQSNNGFILPLTMWVLAGLTLGIVFLDRWNDNLVANALADNERLEKRLKAEELMATLKYALATQLLRRDGFDVAGVRVALDGRVYRTDSGIYFAVQDAAALINLNIPSSRHHLPGLLASMNVAPTEWTRMIDSLADYVDMDDRVRPGGAERFAYRERSLPGPPNHWMYGPMELLRVAGWSGIQNAEATIRNATSIWSFGSYINLNAADAEVLETIPWLNSLDVSKLLSLREERPFLTVSDFKARMGKPDLQLDDVYYGFVPTSYLRVRYWAGGDARLSEFSIRLTPESIDGNPWITAFRSSYHNTLSEEHAEELAFRNL